MDQFVRRFDPLAALCRAITTGDYDHAARIVEKQGPLGLVGFTGDDLRESPVMLALAHGHPRLARRIVDAGYAPSHWEAAGLNLAGSLHALALQHHARLNLCNLDGWAAMHLACYARAHNALAVLTEFGADPNVVACNSSLETPLHSAVRSDDAEGVRILLAAGADQRFPDGAGRTPLQLAIEIAAVEAFDALTE